MWELSDAQASLANDAGDRFVEACPGAGKTRAITQRFKRLAHGQALRGVALVSFTKVAVEAAKERCVDDVGCLQTPNFVGTFDSFINRYISGPLYIREYKRKIEFIESWDLLSFTTMRGKDYPIGIKLEWFDFDISGRATFTPDRVRGAYKAKIVEQANANVDTLSRRAAAIRSSLIRRGILSSSASRWFAAKALGQEYERALMAKLLSSRFSEVIVDEAQDCGAEELAVLRFLRSAGVSITMVADRDQSIFEFRRATPREFIEFARTLTPGIALDGNYRSTPAICAMNNSLRAGSMKDLAVGKCSTLRTPVQLLQYVKPEEVAPAVRSIIGLNSLSAADTIVVAHSRTLACKSAGGVLPYAVSENKIVRLAAASIQLRSRSSDSRIRYEAIHQAQLVLLGLVDGGNSDEQTLTEASAALGLTVHWLRDASIRVLMATNPATVTAEEFTEKMRAVIDKLDWPTSINRRPTNTYLRKPSVKQWNTLGATPQLDSLPWGTIHSVKGKEFESVVVVLPSQIRKDGPDQLSALESWEQRVDSEPRRVLYVGASRAQKLLILAMHKSHMNRVRAILESDDVPFAEWKFDASTHSLPVALNA